MDFTPEINITSNLFRVVHIYNQSNKIHLTRQILMDSSLTQDTCSFFYHILSMDIDEFNNRYGSFAYLTEKDMYEGKLYINVNHEALMYIINFIQTNKIIQVRKSSLVNEIIDLAIIFGMPNLIEKIKNPNEKMAIEQSFND